MLQFILLERKNETAENTFDVTINYYPTNNYKKYSLITQYSSQMGYADNNKTSNLSEGENALKNIANYLNSIRNFGKRSQSIQKSQGTKGKKLI